MHVKRSNAKLSTKPNETEPTLIIAYLYITLCTRAFIHHSITAQDVLCTVLVEIHGSRL